MCKQKRIPTWLAGTPVIFEIIYANIQAIFLKTNYFDQIIDFSSYLFVFQYFLLKISEAIKAARASFTLFML